MDLYQADDWLDARTFGVSSERGGFQLMIPEGVDKLPPGSAHQTANKNANNTPPGILLYRVQVYRGIYGTGGAWDVGYLVGAPDDTLADYRRAAQTLAEHLAGHLDDPYFEQLLKSGILESSTSKRELRTWIDALTHALPRHLDRPPALINSLGPSQKALKADTHAVQGKLKILTAIALMIGLAVLVYLVLIGVGAWRQQDHLLRDVDLEMSGVEDALEDATASEDARDFARSVGRENLLFGAQIVIIVGTLFLFALGLLMLLSYF